MEKTFEPDSPMLSEAPAWFRSALLEYQNEPEWAEDDACGDDDSSEHHLGFV